MSARVRLNIADIILALEFDDPAAAELVGEFDRGFVTESEPFMRMNASWDGPLEILPPDTWSDLPPEVVWDAETVQIGWCLFEGRFRFDQRTGECRVRGIVGLERFLWVLYSLILPGQNGTLVHASSVIRNGLAYLFPADSGTGKSTLVRNSPGCTVLSDDASLIRCMDGHWFAYGSPFRSDNFDDLGWFRAPLAGVFFLEQAPVDRVIPLPPADGLQRLLAQTFRYTEEPVTRQRMFRVAVDLAASARMYRLELRNDSTFWGCVEDVVSTETGA